MNKLVPCLLALQRICENNCVPVPDLVFKTRDEFVRFCDAVAQEIGTENLIQGVPQPTAEINGIRVRFGR